ncbi:MAG: hypothetical protein U9Q15_00600 [Patescibacteria group bacterium]|nr:hypothetical protein [Patescibacteria group bacterium]
MLSGNKTITVVLQNNAELRPNGGFLSSVLQIKTVAGIPYTYDFLNSYDFDSTDIQPLESPSVLSHYFS